jgi:hypothetical protein
MVFYNNLFLKRLKKYWSYQYRVLALYAYLSKCFRLGSVGQEKHKKVNPFSFRTGIHSDSLGHRLQY